MLALQSFPSFSSHYWPLIAGAPPVPALNLERGTEEVYQCRSSQRL